MLGEGAAMVSSAAVFARDGDDALFDALYVNLMQKPWYSPEMDSAEKWQLKCGALMQSLLSGGIEKPALLRENIVTVLQQLTRYEAVYLDSQSFNMLIVVSMLAGREEWAHKLQSMAAEKNQLLQLARFAGKSMVSVDIVFLAMLSENLFHSASFSVSVEKKSPELTGKILQKMAATAQLFFSQKKIPDITPSIVEENANKKGKYSL